MKRPSSIIISRTKPPIGADRRLTRQNLYDIATASPATLRLTLLVYKPTEGQYRLADKPYKIKVANSTDLAKVRRAIHRALYDLVKVPKVATEPSR